MGIHLVIHLDPVVTGDERTNALHGQVRECVHRIYPQASPARFPCGVGHYPFQRPV